MDSKVVFWKRYKFEETGFNVLEICEDGTALDRRFEKQDENHWLYKEVRRDAHQLKGKILIEQIDFGDDGKINESDLAKSIKTVETYELSQWSEARDRAQTRQNLTIESLKEDFHSVIDIEESSVPSSLKQHLPHLNFPIIKFRYENEMGVIMRKAKPRRIETRFVPEINETIYFYLDAGQENLTTTGDNIFSIDTKHCEPDFCESDFDAYIIKMIQEMKNDPKTYHEMFVTQRNRMAMLDTDVIGDLYPR